MQGKGEGGGWRVGECRRGWRVGVGSEGGGRGEWRVRVGSEGEGGGGSGG